MSKTFSITIVTQGEPMKQKLGHYKLQPREMFGPPTHFEWWIQTVADAEGQRVLWGSCAPGHTSSEVGHG